MKTVAYENGGRDAGQHGWVRWCRRCGTTTEDMWDDGYDGMGWKDSDGMEKS